MNVGILLLVALPAILGSTLTAVNAKRFNAAWRAKRGALLAARGMPSD